MNRTMVCVSNSKLWLLLPKVDIGSLWEWVQRGAKFWKSPVTDEFVRIKCEKSHAFLKEAMASRKPSGIKETQKLRDVTGLNPASVCVNGMIYILSLIFSVNLLRLLIFKYFTRNLCTLAMWSKVHSIALSCYISI